MKTPNPVVYAIFVFLISVSAGFSQTPNDDLIKAGMGGDFATVKKLVDEGANVNYRNASGQTVLSVSYMQPQIVEFLISKNADVNGGDYPALVGASRYYSVEVMKMLLKAGADPNKIAVVKVDI